jgi:two-component system chemotaxis response regulator CheY
MITVLVVDDSRFMRNVVKSYFTEMGIPCVYLDAGDGKEALKHLLAQKVDLILLDWNMPKLSGIDFLKEVRAMEQYKDLPIVMVTSESAKFNVIEAAKNGATDYILKPIDGTIFREKMKEIFNL